MRMQSLLKENILLLDKLLHIIEQESDPLRLEALYSVLNYYNAFFENMDNPSYSLKIAWTKERAVTMVKTFLSSLLRITEDDWVHVEYAGAKCPSSVSRELAFLASKASEFVSTPLINNQNKSEVTLQ